ncbi:MAG: hypothetical protein JNL05_05070 [Flavobacteriales bacterium]|nr:hypothetical protein [Flavobacteriales bacterium]
MDSALWGADTSLARQYYAELIECPSSSIHDLRIAFELALVQQDSASATDLFQRCIIQGWTIQWLAEQTPGLRPPYKQSWIASMMDRYPTLLRDSFSVLDTALMGELDAMAKEDQEVRLEPACQNPDETRNDFCPAIQAVDSAHDLRLRAYILRNGLPDPHKLGLSVGSFHLLLLHLTYTRAGVGAWKFYQPILLKGVQEGTFPPGTYAMLFDVHQELVLGQPTLYGMIIRYDEQAGRPRIQPILDPKGVDQRRAAINLPPLSHWAREMDVLLPAGYP